MASITIQAEGEEQQKFALEAATVTLGRGLESDIRLKDIKSSRRHCQIVKIPQGFEVVDLSSGNGTLVNGVQIKQHKLASGDKIQIGHTVITFIDGEAAKPATSRLPAPGTGKGASTGSSAPKPAAAVPATARTAAKKSTGPVPTAAKPAGAATRTGAPKPATGPLPSAPTKKITSKIPAAKPATQPVPTTKPPTQSLSRPSTTSLKKGTTQRTGHTTRSTGFVSATQRFHTEARKKKTNPIVVIIGLIVVVTGAIIGFILFGGGEETDLQKAQLKQSCDRAAKLEEENRLDEAIAEFGKALKIAEGSDVFKGNAATLKVRIKEIQDFKEQLAAASKEFQEFKKRYDSNAAPYRQLWDEGKALQSRCGKLDVPWVKELGVIIETLGKLMDTDRAIEKRMDFQNVRNGINQECALGDKTGKANYSLAVRKWKEYIENKPSDDARNKAVNEISQIGIKINEELRGLRNRAERLADDKKKDEALDSLKQQRPRFEKTEGEEALEKLIKEIEKK